MRVQGSTTKVSENGHAHAGRVQMKAQCGFTLMEVLIVIAIISILLAGAMMLYSQWGDKYQVESETREIYSILMKARNDAANTNTKINVSLAANQVTVHHDTNGDGLVDAGEKNTINSYQRFTINFTASPVVFDRRGLTATVQSIWIDGYSPNAVPAVDCVVIAATRINIGQWTGGPGGACVPE